jgi:Zn-dependent M32 family carboxypeptidase
MLNPADATALAQRFRKLLEENLSEQSYQQFIESNTELVPREFTQNHGVHLDLVIRKLSLAKDYCADFFYMAKSSADWNLILVELEKPLSLPKIPSCHKSVIR